VVNSAYAVRLLNLQQAQPSRRHHPEYRTQKGLLRGLALAPEVIGGMRRHNGYRLSEAERRANQHVAATAEFDGGATHMPVDLQAA
jgi:hypothetical protein